MVTPLAGHVLGEYTVAPCFVLLAVLGVLLLRELDKGQVRGPDRCSRRREQSGQRRPGQPSGALDEWGVARSG
jgi:hypothetical protein